jgi:hypothetical protein
MAEFLAKELKFSPQKIFLSGKNLLPENGRFSPKVAEKRPKNISL